MIGRQRRGDRDGFSLSQGTLGAAIQKFSFTVRRVTAARVMLQFRLDDGQLVEAGRFLHVGKVAAQRAPAKLWKTQIFL